MKLLALCKNCNQEIKSDDLEVNGSDLEDFLKDEYIVIGEVECHKCGFVNRVRATLKINVIIE